MKNIKTKNNINVEYLNVSEIIDTTAFSEFTYFLVKHIENSQEVTYFLKETEFEKLVNGQVVDRDWHDSLLLIKKDILNLIEKYGFYQLSYLYELDNKTEAPKRDKMFSTSIEKDLNNPDFELVKMVKNVNFKFAWMNLDGELKCEPFILSGCAKAELHNDKYHIDELAEYFSHREDIAFITYTGRWDREKSTLLKAPLTGNEESIGGIISEMEHHLEEGESAPAESEEMTIVYYPNKENIKKLIEFDSKIEGRLEENKITKNYFVERYIINEVLGAKQFLIEPPEVEVKVRKFKH